MKNNLSYTEIFDGKVQNEKMKIFCGHPISGIDKIN